MLRERDSMLSKSFDKASFLHIGDNRCGMQQCCLNHLGQPFALLFDEFVLIQVDEVYNRLPTDARIAVKPVCLLHTPVTKSAEQILAHQMPASQQCILMPLHLPVPRIL